MAVADFNLIAPETLECPYPFYEALHEEAPVHFVPELGMAVVSTYDLLTEVVHDPITYSSAIPTGPADLVGEQAEAVDEDLAELRRINLRSSAPTLLAADPPHHMRYRSLVNKALSARRVARMEGYVREIVTGVIDDFIDDGKCDFHEAVRGLRSRWRWWRDQIGVSAGRPEGLQEARGTRPSGASNGRSRRRRSAQS